MCRAVPTTQIAPCCKYKVSRCRSNGFGEWACTSNIITLPCPSTNHIYIYPCSGWITQISFRARGQHKHTNLRSMKAVHRGTDQYICPSKQFTPASTRRASKYQGAERRTAAAVCQMLLVWFIGYLYCNDSLKMWSQWAESKVLGKLRQMIC